jgi:hypothetical protein
VRWQAGLSPEAYDAILYGGVDRMTNVVQDGGRIAANMANISARAPWLQPDTMLALAKSNATDAAIDELGYMSGTQLTSNIAASTAANGLGFVGTGLRKVVGFLGGAFNIAKLIGGALAIDQLAKPLSATGDLLHGGLMTTKKPLRYITAGLDTTIEMVDYTAASVLGGLGVPIEYTEEPVGGFWDSTSIGQLLSHPEEQGEGFVISQQMREAQAREARARRGEINGSAFTIGRGMASIVSTPGTVMYNRLSGMIDIIKVLSIPDPSKGVLKTVRAGLRGVKAAEEIIPIVSKASRAGLIEDLAVAVDTTRMASVRAAADMGLTRTLAGGEVDLVKFNDFFTRDPRAIKFTESMLKETDAGKIFSETFNSKVDPDVAYMLSKATTKDQVVAALTGGYEYGAPVAETTVRGLQMSIKEKAISPFSRTRLLSEFPGRMVKLTGSPTERAEGIKTMALSLKAGGAQPERVNEFLRKAVEATSSVGGNVAVKKVDDLFNDYLIESMIASGVTREAADLAVNKGQETMDIMRSYLRDRNGVNTDNGFAWDLINNPVIKASIGTPLHNEWLSRMSGAGGGFGENLSFGSAIQHADFMDRMRVLPDPRQLRRLTRNPFMSKHLLAAGEKFKSDGGTLIKKKPLLGKKTKMEIVKDRKEYTRIQDEIKALMDPYVGATVPSHVMADVMAKKGLQTALMGEKRVITGEQRVSFAALELVQNGIWKPLTLMTGGYMMRNMLDAQVRMAFAGVGSSNIRFGSGILHPMQYISLVVGRTNKTDLMGNLLTASGRRGGTKGSAYKALEDLNEELAQRISGNARVRGMSSADVAEHTRKTNSWHVAQRSDPRAGLTNHTEGMVQQLQKIHADPLSHIVAKMATSGASDDAIAASVVRKIMGEKDIFANIKNKFKDGIEVWDSNTSQHLRLPAVDLDDVMTTRGVDEVKKILDSYTRKVIVGNANTHIGGMDSMSFIAAYDRLPVTEANGLIKRVYAKHGDLLDTGGNPIVAGGVDIGIEVTLPGGAKGIVVNTMKSGDEGIVVPFKEAGSLTRVKGGTEYTKAMIHNSSLYDETTGKGLPHFVARERSGGDITDIAAGERVKQSWDKTTGMFFNGLNEFTSRHLERSPTFRHFYYKNILDSTDELSNAAAATILKDLGGKAAADGVSIAKFTGSKQLVKKLESIAGNPAHKGVGTIAEVDDYAKMLGLNQMEDLLFNASNTNNLKDILRVIVPFGNAWSEIIGKYFSKLAEDPVHTYRQFQRVETAFEEADPDMDGRGMFYRDPQTNELMFMFPLSGALTQVFGAEYSAGLSAPVKRLSQGINVYPGIGPVAQFAASGLISSTPKNDEIIEMLLPYGKSKDFGDLMPGWLAKAQDALMQNETWTAGIYANTKLETIRAESTTGKYDLSLPEDRQRLLDVSANKARWLTALRAASQFFGPTSGGLEFKVDMPGGDVYVKELIREFHRMQEEDYDSAVGRFISLHGENAALYISSKSESVTPGLEATDDFGDWERNNEDLINAYPRTSNYLAPSFGEFDFKVQGRQMEDEKRKPVSDERMIELAHIRLGSSRYRSAKLQMGPYPSSKEKEILANYRIALSEQYPGFTPRAEFVTNEHYNDLAELTNLIDDQRVRWNPAVPAIKQWLEARAEIMSANNSPTLKSKSMTNARADLFVFGANLAATNPHFDRIWQRLLSEEVED